jgi:uncharacterized protein YqgC (DUF456 family)
MESTLIGVFLGAFIVLMGAYIIINPQFGFKLNHFLERNPRQATEQDLKMMKLSGVVCIVVGVLILAGMLGILR